MIAKLTVHGATREEARKQLVAALEATFIAGTTTNLDFLARLAAQQELRRRTARYRG